MRTLEDPNLFGADAAELMAAGVEDKRRPWTPQSRGWLIRRALVAADAIGLTLAFALALAILGRHGQLRSATEVLLLLATLPVWVTVGRLAGLYDQDEERAEHHTVDEWAGVLNLVTLGVWTFYAATWVTGVTTPSAARMVLFWVLAIVLVTGGRVIARALCRKATVYQQNTLIVGAGDVGQLIGRKLKQHPEYGINLVGFVDNAPKERRVELDDITILGPTDLLPEIIRAYKIERVLVAFSNASHEEELQLIRAVRDSGVQIDLVPRLFDIVGPRVSVHTVEGLPLLGLPPVRLTRSSRLVKRTIDIAGSLAGLLVTAPIFAFIAWRVHRDSPGPIFFRQTRIGLDMKEFTTLKFRTMYVDTDDSEHRAYIKATMDAGAAPEENGLYKLERKSAITKSGRWLRASSLDELPQLINVLRGDMSLVGPRPCLAYETENFEPHHFERFLVPAGLTGLWQVTARAHATFREALDLDVAYARGWSLTLDLRLLIRTPVQMLQRKGTK
jgi:exopolysaccharide biosynthesis polyprenyl glycosylphosphotransferase